MPTPDPLVVALTALFGAGLVGLTKMSLSSKLMLAAAVAAGSALLERGWGVVMAHSETFLSSLFRWLDVRLEVRTESVSFSESESAEWSGCSLVLISVVAIDT